MSESHPDDMTASVFAHPVLRCDQARAFESNLLADETAEWAAMQKAGKGIARAIVRDYHELRPVPQHLRVLALVGKGHNGGDALLSCGQFLADYPCASITVLLASAPGELRPLAACALKGIEGRVKVEQIAPNAGRESILQLLEKISSDRGFDVCLDGLLGQSFEGALRAPMAALLEVVNGYAKIGLRAAVDVPSGKGDSSDTLFFQADFTYATGIPKCVQCHGSAECGRIRYIDLGFFDKGDVPTANEFLLNYRVLNPLCRLRPASVDKRFFGHLFIIGGSAFMPGALLMAVQSAVRSGVGLVTAFAPASVAAALAAQVPEAMWVSWPETVNGTLNPRAMPLLLDRIEDANAVLVGPGMGYDRNTEMVVQSIVNQVELPIICDADALRIRVVELVPRRRSICEPVVLTPHMGEFMRIAKLSKVDYTNETLLSFCRSYKTMTVLKGAITRICDGQTVFYNSYGGPVLSRGGSGDLLAGLIGGMVAQDNANVQTAVARGVVLHGLAAECLARQCGQVAVNTTRLLEHLPEVLRRPGGFCDFG